MREGFHLSRRQLNVLPNPEEAYARRGAPWTFNGGAFYQAVLHLREAGRLSQDPLLLLSSQNMAAMRQPGLIFVIGEASHCEDLPHSSVLTACLLVTVVSLTCR